MTKYSTIFTKGQQKILACVERDAASLRLSAMVAVQLGDGKISEPVAVQRQKLISHGIGTLAWLLDYEANLEQKDLETIKDALLNLLVNPKEIYETASRATQEEVIERLSEFAMDRKEELVRIGEVFAPPKVLSRGDKVYIRTNAFATFFESNKDLGWSKLEVLKLLKRNDLLETGTGRVYDKKVKVNGKGTYYYVIKIENMPANDMADETLEFKEKES